MLGLDRMRYVSEHISDDETSVRNICEVLTKDYEERFFYEWNRRGYSKASVVKMIENKTITSHTINSGRTVIWFLGDDPVIKEIRKYATVHRSYNDTSSMIISANTMVRFTYVCEITFESIGEKE